jgi:hypothetical protein
MSKTYRGETGKADASHTGGAKTNASRPMPDSFPAGIGQTYSRLNEIPVLVSKRPFEPPRSGRTAAASLAFTCCALFAPITEAQTQLTGSQLRILSNTQTGTSYTVS